MKILGTLQKLECVFFYLNALVFYKYAYIKKCGKVAKNKDITKKISKKMQKFH